MSRSMPLRFMWRRGLKRFAIMTVVLLALIAIPLAVIVYPTLKPYPSIGFTGTNSPSDGNLQDLAHLRRLPEVERSFIERTRANFRRSIDSIEQMAGDLNKAGLAMAIAKAVALADNGHTNVIGIAGDYGFNAVPVRLGWFADGLFVVATADRQRDLLGAQILGVNGRTTAELVGALRPYVGGPANLAKEFVPNFLISPELLQAAGLADAADNSIYEFHFADGRIAPVALTAQTRHT